MEINTENLQQCKSRFSLIVEQILAFTFSTILVREVKKLSPIFKQIDIETSQLVCCANQLTGFYMRATLAFNGLIQLTCPYNQGGLNKEEIPLILCDIFSILIFNELYLFV